MHPPSDITQQLDRLRELEGEPRQAALRQVVSSLYGELKALARSQRYRWEGRKSFGTTSLVHEAFAKLASGAGARPETRKQFYALAATVMRSILVDQARSELRLKRGAGRDELPLDDERLVSQERSTELLALDSALANLEAKEPELAKVVECRCFGGLSVEETAHALALSTATIKRRWALARSWLYRELASDPGAGAGHA